MGFASLFSPILRVLLELAVNGSGAATLDSFYGARARVSVGGVIHGACVPSCTSGRPFECASEERVAVPVRGRAPLTTPGPAGPEFELLDSQRVSQTLRAHTRETSCRTPRCMGATVLRITSYEEASEALDVLRAYPHFARAVTSASLSPEYDATKETFTELLLPCTNLQSLYCDEVDFANIYIGTVNRLAQRQSFDHLLVLHITTFEIQLSVVTLFRLLSTMPSLRALTVGVVVDGKDDAALLPDPACRLREFRVDVTSCMSFVHYSKLLSKSHDTLQCLELSWTQYADELDTEDVVQAVVQAITPCSRLHSLEIIDYVLPQHLDRIIAACPRIQRLGLKYPPLPEEIAALPHDGKTLVQLDLVDFRGQVRESMVSSLRELQWLMPALRTLRIVSNDDPNERWPVDYPLLYTECAKRRVNLVVNTQGYERMFA